MSRCNSKPMLALRFFMFIAAYHFERHEVSLYKNRCGVGESLLVAAPHLVLYKP